MEIRILQDLMKDTDFWDTLIINMNVSPLKSKVNRELFLPWIIADMEVGDMAQFSPVMKNYINI